MSWGHGEERAGTLLSTAESLVAASDRQKWPRDAVRNEDQRRTGMGLRSQVLGSGDPPHSPMGPWTSDRRTRTSQSSHLDSGARPGSEDGPTLRAGTGCAGNPARGAVSVSFVTGRKRAKGPQRRVSGTE